MISDVGETVTMSTQMLEVANSRDVEGALVIVEFGEIRRLEAPNRSGALLISTGHATLESVVESEDTVEVDGMVQRAVEGQASGHPWAGKASFLWLSFELV